MIDTFDSVHDIATAYRQQKGCSVRNYIADSVMPLFEDEGLVSISWSQSTFPKGDFFSSHWDAEINQSFEHGFRTEGEIGREPSRLTWGLVSVALEALEDSDLQEAFGSNVLVCITNQGIKVESA